MRLKRLPFKRNAPWLFSVLDGGKVLFIFSQQNFSASRARDNTSYQPVAFAHAESNRDGATHRYPRLYYPQRNRGEWELVETTLKENTCDALLISLEARGTAVSVLADSLERTVRSRKEALSRGDLCLVTPYNPSAGFSVGAAMGRNRLIYTLADYAIVIASDAESGDTWAGATEALKNNWLPVFVLEHEQMPDGNKLLLQKGALAFPHPFRDKPVKLSEWMNEKAASLPPKPNQPSLF